MDRQKSKSRISLVRTTSLSPNYAPQDGYPEISVNNEEEIQEPKKQQVNVHQFILSEFKEKYDQLKSQFQAKKKEADSLLYDKKKLEIQLLNHNVEYYEKQIVRLRGEVEKYQMENEQNKHRFFIAQNSRKDLEATSKVRQEELKQALKQLEKEKIHVVQLQHQITEKDKNFNSVISDLQANNQQISEKYDSTNNSLQKSENQLKTKIVEIDQLKRKTEQLGKALQEKQEQLNSNQQKSELNEYRFKHRIEDLQEELKDIHSKQSQKIKKLQAQVKELQSKRKSQQFLLAQKNDAANYSLNLRKKEEQIGKLQEKVRELSFYLNERQQRVKVLEQKLKNVCSIDLLSQSQEKYADALIKHQNIQKNLENRISYLEKELEMSKLRPAQSSTNIDSRMKVDFQQLLKNQIEQNSKLKLEISLKIDQIYSLKNTIEQQHIKQSLLENEIDILRKKQRAQQKNSKIGFEIEIQNLKNDVESLRRKLQVTETKLNIKLKQVKDKDSFISSVIIGRSKQEDVPFVMAELKRIFEAEYVNKLSEANFKIQDLQLKINTK